MDSMKMWSRVQLLLLLFIAIMAQKVKLTEANVLFRFSLGFRVNSGDSMESNADEVFNKTIIFDNNHLTIRNNLDSNDIIDEDVVTTEGINDSELTPITTTVAQNLSMNAFWLQNHGAANINSMKIVEAISNLKREIAGIKGRSEYLEFRLALINNYLNYLTSSATVVDLEYYRKCIEFVSVLQEPNDAGEEHSMDYTLLKLALEKYNIIELKKDVINQLHVAKEAWKHYLQTKLVEVDV